ncbi:Eisosome component PIL1-domain-containing protein, partial [Bombardia bombarda]
SSTSSHTHTGRRGFHFSSLRGTVQPELSKKLYRLIKSENNLISAHETAAKERVSIATQLSEWGEQTGDEAISDISDKVGVVLSELGEQEDNYAHALDDSRGTLKTIRNTEKSVQPSRDGKAKIADEIAKLKSKEPESTRLVVLEQELVRAEAENLVAEAQLTNITRQKLKEAYQAEFLATIERAEKQTMLARHGLRLLQLLDDTPVVPGDVRPQYQHAGQARQILNDAEDDLREWRPETGANVGDNATDVGGSTSSNATPVQSPRVNNGGGYSGSEGNGGGVSRIAGGGGQGLGQQVQGTTTASTTNAAPGVVV